MRTSNSKQKYQQSNLGHPAGRDPGINTIIASMLYQKGITTSTCSIIAIFTITLILSLRTMPLGTSISTTPSNSHSSPYSYSPTSLITPPTSHRTNSPIPSKSTSNPITYSRSQPITNTSAIVVATHHQLNTLINQHPHYFDLIINTTFNIDIYTKICSLLTNKGTIVTYTNHFKNISKLETLLQITVQEQKDTINDDDRQQSLLTQLQHLQKPQPSIYNLIKTIPIPLEDLTAKLLQQYLLATSLPKSKHSKLDGYITYQIITDVEFSSLKYIWNFLRQQLPQSILKSIRNIQKMENQRGVVFDIPINLKDILDGLISRMNRDKNKYKGYKIEEVILMPKLQDINCEEYKKMVEKKQYCLRHKSELEIFIGGIPYDASESDIRQFFKSHLISLFMIRILRDSDGFSKGISFALCQDHDNFNKAIQLSGTKFGERTLRIKLADQK